mmetsp:Transcript_93614/g.268349  ORF Transcript_93614/g.268349 Transcript_93614/m.268349 type:complete len:265 (+) Transcript_93614:517-1311(+)
MADLDLTGGLPARARAAHQGSREQRGMQVRDAKLLHHLCQLRGRAQRGPGQAAEAQGLAKAVHHGGSVEQLLPHVRQDALHLLLLGDALQGRRPHPRGHDIRVRDGLREVRPQEVRHEEHLLVLLPQLPHRRPGPDPDPGRRRRLSARRVRIADALSGLEAEGGCRGLRRDRRRRRRLRPPWGLRGDVGEREERHLEVACRRPAAARDHVPGSREHDVEGQGCLAQRFVLLLEVAEEGLPTPRLIHGPNAQRLHLLLIGARKPS